VSDEVIKLDDIRGITPEKVRRMKRWLETVNLDGDPGWSFMVTHIVNCPIPEVEYTITAFKVDSIKAGHADRLALFCSACNRPVNEYIDGYPTVMCPHCKTMAGTYDTLMTNRSNINKHLVHCLDAVDLNACIWLYRHKVHKANERRIIIPGETNENSLKEIGVYTKTRLKYDANLRGLWSTVNSFLFKN